MAAKIALDHCHSVGGKGARLVRADGRRITHSLTGVQVTNQVIVL